MRPWAVLAALAVAAALVAGHALWLALTAFGTCSRSPGGPTSCESTPSPPALLIAGLLATAAAGMVWGRGWMAWAAVLPALGLALLFGLSVGGVLLPHVGAVVLLAAAAQLVRRRRRIEAAPAAA